MNNENCPEPGRGERKRVNRAEEVREVGPGRASPVFHYNRDERLAMRIDTPTPTSRGWLRGNRSMMILLIDVGVVVIMALIYLFFLQPATQRTAVGPYRFSGRAFRFEGEILVVVRVERADAVGGSANTVGARIDGEGSQTVRDVAPARVGDVRELSVRHEDTGAQSVRVQVYADDNVSYIELPVR